MSTLKGIRTLIDKTISAACCFLFATMIVIGTYQILTRYIFNSPSTVSEELLTYAFTWMALLISAYLFGKREHMRVAFLADKVTGRAKLALDIATEALIVIIAAVVLVYGGFRIMELTLMQKTASLGISMGSVYSVVPLTGILTVIYGLMNIVDIVDKDGSHAAGK